MLTEVKEISGGRVLKLTGLTPEGKLANRRASQGMWARKDDRSSNKTYRESNQVIE